MKSCNLAKSAMYMIGLCAASVGWAAEPIAWGPTTGAKGCVILREYEQLDSSSSHEETGTTAKSHFQLSVLTSTGRPLPKTTWADDSVTMDELQRIAQADQTRMVKIREPYSEDDMQAAQRLCSQATAPVQ